MTFSAANTGNTANIVINPTSADVDFTINGDTTADLFRVDAGTEVLTVSATTTFSGAVRINNASTTLTSSSATTTLRLQNDTGTQGSCIAAETPDGTEVWMRFTTTGVTVDTTSCE